ncbi:hypothetical protein VE00_07701 [Pseudogymnoascus sp. WSF 3629]|nr:hypothetical protein VE00_07701 [Pseudogymnoascus sp. WSF 3629]
MRFTLPTIALILSGTAFALPAAEQRDKRDTVQTVHLTFHGGPASYEMAFPADGTIHPTNHDFAVSIIDAPDYLALSDCTFHTGGEQTLVGGLSATGVQQVIIGPPQPITGVSCYGTCVGTYGQCYDNNNQFIGPCCNGYCAATRCRPWINRSA